MRRSRSMALRIIASSIDSSQEEPNVRSFSLPFIQPIFLSFFFLSFFLSFLAFFLSFSLSYFLSLFLSIFLSFSSLSLSVCVCFYFFHLLFLCLSLVSFIFRMFCKFCGDCKKFEWSLISIWLQKLFQNRRHHRRSPRRIKMTSTKWF